MIINIRRWNRWQRGRILIEITPGEDAVVTFVDRGDNTVAVITEDQMDLLCQEWRRVRRKP